MQALFKLRLTSKAFGDRINTLVGGHVLLGTPEANSTPLYLPKMYRFDPGPSSWFVQADPSAVRVLDIDFDTLGEPAPSPFTGVTMGRALSDVLSPFTGVTTVRRSGRIHTGNAELFYLTPSARTVVDYAPLSAETYIPLSPGRRHADGGDLKYLTTDEWRAQLDVGEQQLFGVWPSE